MLLSQIRRILKTKIEMLTLFQEKEKRKSLKKYTVKENEMK